MGGGIMTLGFGLGTQGTNIGFGFRLGTQIVGAA